MVKTERLQGGEKRCSCSIAVVLLVKIQVEVSCSVVLLEPSLIHAVQEELSPVMVDERYINGTQQLYHCFGRHTYFPPSFHNGIWNISFFLKSECLMHSYKDRIDASVRETKIFFACLLFLNVAHFIFNTLIL